MSERKNIRLRLLDKYAGIILIAAIFLLRKLKHIIQNTLISDSLIRKILLTPRLNVVVLKSAAIGDTIFLSAIVRDLKLIRPSCRIKLICGSSNEEMSHLIDGVDEVVQLNMTKPFSIWMMRSRLRGDVFIDFDSWPRINALISFFSGSQVSIGFKTAGQYRHLLQDIQVTHSDGLHEIENYRNLISVFTLGADKAILSKAQPWIKDISYGATKPQAEVEAPYVVFHMFSGGSQGYFKEWPQSNWIQLAHLCVAQGYRVVLSGGPNDFTKNQSFSACFQTSDSIFSLPTGTLTSLMLVLKNAETVVSVDTGIAHLAGALGAQTIVLYGATSPTRWGALGDNVRHLKDGQTPWINLGFESAYGGTQVQLTAAEVHSAFADTDRKNNFVQET